VSDDPAQALAVASTAAAVSTPAPTDEDGQPIARPYVQIVEATAGPTATKAALENRDPYGRVPVLVRVARQPPINPVWFLVAIGLAASGLFVPLGLALKAMLIVAAVVAVGYAILSRILLTIPPAAVGLLVKGGRHHAVLGEGVRWVTPNLALTHVVTTREFAFDVPVAEVRSRDGVGVTVDVLLTLRIADPRKFVYSITTGDLDQLTHAAAQDAVRTMIRGMQALNVLDIGTPEADALRAAIDARLEPFGVEVPGAAITRVTLPTALTASLEARRLASVQLLEEEENFALDQRRLNDRAKLIAAEQDTRRAAVGLEAQAEALRLAKLEERIGAFPNAARYDLELERLRVAQQLAGNSRAVVSLGASDLVSDLLVAREAGSVGAPVAADPAPAPVTAAPPATPAEPAPDETPAGPVRRRVAGRVEGGGAG
jgi:regulator of protease activity HflC (stomatin/prohibitin superfamily)